ncbi:retrotransposon hot spot (RHS) protein [Trypanosoma rangeli]|uniref:Retrotransposon hot spot (RHS) protein n=1 Tax=Trypanosoma rangeli TaxID=5698 RepID=A0A422MZ15_TRYRA|nr:retrotransposon hot spot (RHS) protein [Trypanosoma rangeli]RNE98411.1 retrotransposon hot spot (RHS) protein [Trypanosoma rangeli]|eukprot:RNE98411.1 retrotransposon hot spot (RHS) protein [Trypanosoma rangeli]
MANKARSGMKRCVIIDMARYIEEPSNNFVPFSMWGIIALSSLIKNNYDAWVSNKTINGAIMNYHDELSVKAMCVWRMRHQPTEEQDDTLSGRWCCFAKSQEFGC